MHGTDDRAKVTAITLRQMKARGERIAALTAYDTPSARFADLAGAEVILVGDSLGQVVLGHPSTLPVTMEDMLHHTRAAARAQVRALLVADMPFMSYQASVADAVRNAGRFVQEASAEAVKLEGGEPVMAQVRAIVEAGIPVMGHLGLTPQSVLRFGGYKVQGREPEAADLLRRGARALEEAGCFSIVLEAIPPTLAREVTAALGIPTIGIGAGPHCDGQVLVSHDLLGLTEGFTPKFVKRYAEMGAGMREAFERYVAEVKNGAFPGPEHCYGESAPAAGPAKDAAAGTTRTPSGARRRH